MLDPPVSPWTSREITNLMLGHSAAATLSPSYRWLAERLRPLADLLAPAAVETALLLADRGALVAERVPLIAETDYGLLSQHAQAARRLADRADLLEGVPDRTAVNTLYYVVMLADMLLSSAVLDSVQSRVNDWYQESGELDRSPAPSSGDRARDLLDCLERFSTTRWAPKYGGPDTTVSLLELAELQHEPRLWLTGLHHDSRELMLVLDRAARLHEVPDVLSHLADRQPFDPASLAPETEHALQQIFLRKAAELHALYAGPLWRFRPRGQGLGVDRAWLASVALDLQIATTDAHDRSLYNEITRTCLGSLRTRRPSDLPERPDDLMPTIHRQLGTPGLSTKAALVQSRLASLARASRDQGRADLLAPALRLSHEGAQRLFGPHDLRTHQAAVARAKHAIEIGEVRSVVRILGDVVGAPTASDPRRSADADLLALALVEAGRLDDAVQFSQKFTLSPAVAMTVASGKSSTRRLRIAILVVFAPIVAVLAAVVSWLVEKLPLPLYTHVYAALAFLVLAPAALHVVRRRVDCQLRLPSQQAGALAVVLTACFALGVHSSAEVDGSPSAVAQATVALVVTGLFFFQLLTASMRAEWLNVLTPNLGLPPDLWLKARL